MIVIKRILFERVTETLADEGFVRVKNPYDGNTMKGVDRRVEMGMDNEMTALHKKAKYEKPRYYYTILR